MQHGEGKHQETERPPKRGLGQVKRVTSFASSGRERIRARRAERFRRHACLCLSGRQDGGNVVDTLSWPHSASGEHLTENQRIIRSLWCDVEDRKSTRLNSSHANISYAVFCLKKKGRDRG